MTCPMLVNKPPKIHYVLLLSRYTIYINTKYVIYINILSIWDPFNKFCLQICNSTKVDNIYYKI